MHTTKERLKKAQILANEVILLEKMCVDILNDERLKAYQLSQTAALARDVICDTINAEQDQCFE